MQKLGVIAKKWFQVRKSDWFYFIIVDGSKKHRKKWLWRKNFIAQSQH